MEKIKKYSNIKQFVDSPIDFDKLENEKIYQAIKQLEEDGKNSILKSMYNSSFNCWELLQGCYKLGGWFFDLRKYCKCFLVRFKNNDTFTKYYAPNKTTFYNSLYITRSQIAEIIEVENIYK